METFSNSVAGKVSWFFAPEHWTWFSRVTKHLRVRDKYSVANHVGSFAPSYVEDLGLVSKIRNSMIEVKELYHITEEAIRRNLEEQLTY